MPFLLGQPQLLFFEAEHEEAEIATIIRVKITKFFRFFMLSNLKFSRAGQGK